ncbi:MAG: hypothetical protein U0166_13385 [Acidobacteriota bacterium]
MTGSPPPREAFACYRRAYVAYLDDHDLPRARQELARAAELEPLQAVYRAVAGLVALEEGRFSEAEEWLASAIALGHPDEERAASFLLWRGRARDVQGRRHDALADYDAALAMTLDPPARRAAERGRRRPFAARRAARVHVDMALGDVIRP